MAGPFTIVVNMPGCLPEMEPYQVDTDNEAYEALADELGRTAEGFELDWEQLDEALDELRNGSRSIYLGGYFHSAEIAS